MPPQDAYVVLGLNESALACALELRQHGQEVVLFPHEGAVGWVADNYCVGPTPLNRRPISGFEFERLGYAALAAGGVHMEYDFMTEAIRLAPTRQRLVFTEVTGAAQTAKRVIWAPLGVAPQEPTALNGESYLGRSFTYSAASGFLTRKGEAAAVLGSGSFAMRQACLAAETADAVLLVTPGARELPFPELCGEECRGRITRIRDAEGVRIRGTEKQIVPDLTVRISGQETTLPVDWVFHSEERVLDWSYWGSQQTALEWIDAGLLFLTALAAGVDYTDSEAMWRHGVATARAALAADPG